jgi:hypothetical protein
VSSPFAVSGDMDSPTLQQSHFHCNQQYRFSLVTTGSREWAKLTTTPPQTYAVGVEAGRPFEQLQQAGMAGRRTLPDLKRTS